MTQYLIQITIGPVQDFIAQARRTRDLWYGSHLLSELSRAVARSLHAHPGVVPIFPALGRDEVGQQGDCDPGRELDSCVEPFRPPGHPNAGKAPISVANIILATVATSSDGDVRELAEKAREDLLSFWRIDVAAKIKKRCAELLADDIDKVWNEQIVSLIEFTAAWSPIEPDADEPNAYKATRNRLNRAIAGRKNLRDFEPWLESRPGTPKSSLDGARETVLKVPRSRPSGLIHKYRLGDNEQLDAVGLVKRAGGETKQNQGRSEIQFVPLINVALAPWLELAKTQTGSILDDCTKEMDAVEERIGRQIACGNDLLDFDAGIFMEGRWWPTCKEQGILEPSDFWSINDPNTRRKEEAAWREKARQWRRAHLGPKHHENEPNRLLDVMAEPHPYVCCLVADGDGMGRAIDALGSDKEHRNFSKNLAEFAKKAREIVENITHLGSLVYAGGDDVLAFVPVSNALSCAHELQSAFGRIMEKALRLPDGTLRGDLDKTPTLSVGLGIGHVMESMSDLLQLGRDAEKLAKGGHLKRLGLDRNALAIILDKRSGGTRKWREKWDKAPVQRLLVDQGLLNGPLSKRKVYQIARTLRSLPDAEATPAAQKAAFEHVLISEVRRELRRTDGGEGALTPEEAGLELAGVDGYDALSKAVERWIDRVLIARSFTEANPRVKGAETKEEADAA